MVSIGQSRSSAARLVVVVLAAAWLVGTAHAEPTVRAVGPSA